MKPTKQIISLLTITALAATSPLALGAGAGGDGGGSGRKRPDPNAIEKIASPFTGTVVNIAGSTISVRGEPQLQGKVPKGDTSSKTRTLHFTIKPDVKILRDGKPATFADIKENDPIAVSFTAKEGSSIRHATEIQAGAIAKDAEKKGEAKKGGGKKKKK
ncbi:MAG: hypothetical protein HZA91_19650 [Verrucomicrobia bacterium]|nr:hypothetical protein [Verrucomicrobiota bacterium]